MYGLKIKDYLSDLQGLLLLLAIVIGVIIWKYDYLFSQETLSQVQIKDQKELSKPVEGLVEPIKD